MKRLIRNTKLEEGDKIKSLMQKKKTQNTCMTLSKRWSKAI